MRSICLLSYVQAVYLYAHTFQNVTRVLFLQDIRSYFSPGAKSKLSSSSDEKSKGLKNNKPAVAKVEVFHVFAVHPTLL